MKELMSGAGALIYVFVMPVVFPLIVVTYGITRIFLVIGYLRNMRVIWSPVRYHHLLQLVARYASGIRRMIPVPRRLANVFFSKP